MNVVPAVQSVYQWEGKLVEEEEALLLCKTVPERYEEVRAAIRELHRYDVPEVIAVEVPLPRSAQPVQSRSHPR